jgi:hypothetical protein
VSDGFWHAIDAMRGELLAARPPEIPDATTMASYVGTLTTPSRVAVIGHEISPLSSAGPCTSPIAYKGNHGGEEAAQQEKEEKFVNSSDGPPMRCFSVIRDGERPSHGRSGQRV